MPPVHNAHLPADHACLIVHGSDKPGIVAAVSAMITRIGGNIVAFDQFSDDHRGGAYFQRVVFNREGFAADRPTIEAEIDRTLADFDLEWELTDQSTPKRMAILASKQDHCLLDLLWRHRRGDLPVTIPMVISNHTTTAEDVRSFGVPFFHVPSVAGPDKTASEAEILKLLVGNVDFVVLARYMQILSPEFLDAVGVPVIASGGVGSLEDLADGVTIGGADAVLAASIFHYGEYTIQQAKECMRARGIPVRL